MPGRNVSKEIEREKPGFYPGYLFKWQVGGLRAIFIISTRYNIYY
jgi:hypothetical protein